MKSSLIAPICVAALAAFAAGATAQRTSLTPTDQTRLETLVASHCKERARLPVEYRNTLDQLTAIIRKNLFAHLPNVKIHDATIDYLHKHLPALTDEEVQTLTDYSLGGVASGDPVGAAAGETGSQNLLNATKQMQETQMSFNLQYLQLQNQMQNENRQYTAVSNIMKTKHDTVKNSISNVR